MKKYLILPLLLLFLTGCSKKLNCTKVENETGLNYNEEINVTFNKNKISNFSLKYDISLEEEYLSYVDTFKETLESTFSSLKDKKGIKYSVKDNKNGFVINMSANLKKLDNDVKKELNMIETDENYEEMKKDLISAGYTCK